MSSVINLLRFTDNDYVTDQLTLSQGAIIWGNASGDDIVPEILEAPFPGAKKFLSISDQGIISWEDLDTNSSHPVNQDVGTNATKWIIEYTTGNASTESHIIWTKASNSVELKKGDGTAWNNLKVAALTTSGITSTGAITCTNITGNGNASFTGTLNADGNWNLGSWGSVIATHGTIKSNVINAYSTFITLNSANSARDNIAGGYKYKYDEGGSDYITWYYSGDINNVSWVSNKPINLATGQDYRINQTSVLNETTLGENIVYSSLQTVDTITSGTWEGNEIAIKYGGTGLIEAGSSNQLLGMDSSGGSMEYKTLSVSGGLSINHTAGGISISASGINTDTYLMKPRPDAKEGYLFADGNDLTNDGILRTQRASSLSGLSLTYNPNNSPTLSWVGLDWKLNDFAINYYIHVGSPTIDTTHSQYVLLYDSDISATKSYRTTIEEFLAVALDRASSAISAPNNSGSSGTKSSILYDDDYLYICVGTDTWKRIPLSTF